MSEFFQICCITALGCALLLVFSAKEKELMLILSALLTVLILLCSLDRFSTMLSIGRSLLQREFSSFSSFFLPLFGITLGGMAASAVCEAVGQKGIAGILELLTVLEILAISISPICDMLDTVFALLKK